MANPYEVSEADPDLEIENKSITTFKRKSVLLIILLSVITFGIYPFYWIVTRTKVLNQLIPKKAIPAGFTLTITVLYIAIFLMGFVAGLMDNQQLQTITNLLNFPIGISMIVWYFKFKHRLENITKEEYSGIAVFFLNAFYFQYRINKLIDSEATA